MNVLEEKALLLILIWPKNIGWPLYTELVLKHFPYSLAVWPRISYRSQSSFKTFFFQSGKEE